MLYYNTRNECEPIYSIWACGWHRHHIFEREPAGLTICEFCLQHFSFENLYKYISVWMHPCVLVHVRHCFLIDLNYYQLWNVLNWLLTNQTKHNSSQNVWPPIKSFCGSWRHFARCICQPVATDASCPVRLTTVARRPVQCPCSPGAAIKP